MRAASTVRAVWIIAGMLAATQAPAADLAALQNTTPAERAQAQTTMMRAKLGLTDAQTPAVAALNLRYAEKMEPIIKGSQGPLLKMRDARAVEEQKEAELKTLVSADQFAAFLAAKEDMRRQFADRIAKQRAQDGK